MMCIMLDGIDDGCWLRMEIFGLSLGFDFEFSFGSCSNRGILRKADNRYTDLDE